jgi:hypothetical protein
MPRTYKKLGKRCNWSNETLEDAIADVRNKVLSIRAAARAYNIPRSTLQEYMNSSTRVRPLSEEHKPGKVGRYSILGADFERELCEHVKKMSDLYFGLTKEQLCRLAYELAWKNGIKHNFNNDKKMAGTDWFYGFMSRNPSVSLRKPEATSLSRVIGFRRNEVQRFFDNLTSVYDKEKFDASHIFNVDETGMSTVQQQRQKILAPHGKKQVGKIVSGEKGETITAVVCISASGVFLPPMLVFPRKNFNNRLLYGAPPGTVGSASPSGWINTEIYLSWLKHFVQYSGAKPENKVLLVLDNHQSHISIQAWEYCRANGIVVVSLPPHCSHKCQPLDISVFGPLKTAYYKRCNDWMKSNPGKRITQYEVASLFSDAYCSTASVAKCVSGFKSAGIHPLNTSIFTDEDFEAADNLLHPVASSSSTSAAASATVASSSAPAMDAVMVASSSSTSAAASATVAVQNVHERRIPGRKRRYSVEDISPVPISYKSAVIYPDLLGGNFSPQNHRIPPPPPKFPAC